MDNSGKKRYSEALVACSVHRRMIMACPVAFGEVAVKTRIKGILRYHKPSFWLLLAAAVTCMATAVCFLTDPIPCTHAYTGEITVCSTCTEKGIQTLTCPLCDHSYTARAELLAHDFRQGDVLIPPDCVHLGTRELVCAGCGATKTEEIEKTGHAFGTPFVSKAPNCVQTGEMSAECTVCHTVQVIEVIAPNQDHDLQETVVTAATCVKPGKGKITCSRCDHTENCTYDPHGHDFVPMSCISNGRQMQKCAICGAVYLKFDDLIDAHIWVSSGGMVYCSSCGTVASRSESPQTSNGISLITNPFFSNQNQQPQYPAVKWDVAADMSPIPDYPSVP